MTVIKIWTDGCCKGNPGRGGWGVYAEAGEETFSFCGGEKHTTNNRMELLGAIQGLLLLENIQMRGATEVASSVIIYTDSSYVQKGITEWIIKWKKNNWMKGASSKSQPVKNADLWKILDEEYSKYKDIVKWEWVKGHAGNTGNERADSMANKGAEQYIN